MLNMFINHQSDENLVKSLQTEDSLPAKTVGILTKATCACMLFSNDMKHIHLHAHGNDFDTIHEIADTYFSQASKDLDDLAELALELSQEVPNMSRAVEYLTWDVSTETKYNYIGAVTAIAKSLEAFITVLLQVQQSTAIDSDVQSNIDEHLRFWKKELNYKLKHRLEES